MTYSGSWRGQTWLATINIKKEGSSDLVPKGTFLKPIIEKEKTIRIFSTYVKDTKPVKLIRLATFIFKLIQIIFKESGRKIISEENILFLWYLHFINVDEVN